VQRSHLKSVSLCRSTTGEGPSKSATSAGGASGGSKASGKKRAADDRSAGEEAAPSVEVGEAVNPPLLRGPWVEGRTRLAVWAQGRKDAAGGEAGSGGEPSVSCGGSLEAQRGKKKKWQCAEESTPQGSRAEGRPQPPLGPSPLADWGCARSPQGGRGVCDKPSARRPHAIREQAWGGLAEPSGSRQPANVGGDRPSEELGQQPGMARVEVPSDGPSPGESPEAEDAGGEEEVEVEGGQEPAGAGGQEPSNAPAAVGPQEPVSPDGRQPREAEEPARGRQSVEATLSGGGQARSGGPVPGGWGQPRSVPAASGAGAGSGGRGLRREQSRAAPETSTAAG